MAEQIKTVTDKKQFEALFNKLFTKNEVFIKSKSGDLKVQFLGYSDGHVAFRVPYVKSLPDPIIVFTRQASNTIYSTLSLFERNEDTFIFNPVKFQIISGAGREERKSTGSKEEGTNIIYVNNILSDLIIKNTFSMNIKKLDKIKDHIIHDMEKQFEKIDIYFVNEGGNNPRMKYILDSGSPFFIENFNEKPDSKYEKIYNFYMENVYSSDYKLSSRKEYISETTVPVIYRNIIPFGYIQVNRTSPMTETHLSIIKEIAITTNKLFEKNNLFIPSENKFLVSDISKSGLSIVFKDRKLTRLFNKNSFVCLDVLLTGGKKASLGAYVKNVTFLESKIIKIGMEITSIDPSSEANFNELLKTLPGKG